jgi:predicted Zn-dependent peptidase
MAKSRFKQFKGDVDVFVPKGQEQQYLSKHGVAVRHLANGALIVGTTRRVEDAADVRVNVHFPYASYYEPVGKRGVSHLVEHFVFNKPHFLANEKEAYYNAMTFSTHMELIMRGRAHPRVKDHGILPVVPVALEQVTQPLEVTESSLKSEKNVVLGEIYEYQSDGNITERLSLFEKTLFSQDHPQVYNPLGTKGEVRGLTTEDVREYHKRVFVPQGLIATVFVEGSPAITRTVLKELEKRISIMPKRKGNPKAIDTSLLNKINPRYKQGATYKKHAKSRDKQIKIHYVWLLPKTDYSVHTFAESRFFDVAQQKMFQSFRKKGLGYTADPVDMHIGEKKRVLGFVVTVAKNGEDSKKFANRIYQELKSDTFEQFDDTDITNILNVTQRRSVTGTSVSERFSDVVTGLKEYGRIIDSDKVQEVHKMITPEHLWSAQKTFLATPPTVILEGDLS